MSFSLFLFVKFFICLNFENVLKFLQGDGSCTCASKIGKFALNCDSKFGTKKLISFLEIFLRILILISIEEKLSLKKLRLKKIIIFKN